MTAPYGPLTIGRITLTEPIEVSSKGGDTRVVTLAGLDSDQTFTHPTQDQIRARAEALLSSSGAVVPVAFTALPHLNGWYQVGSPGADEFSWYDTTAIEWTADLTLIGTPGQIEFESRLVGGNRAHVTGATAQLWHAPPAGADTYTVGSTSPGYVTRTSADGAVRAFLNLTAGGNPRWGLSKDLPLPGAYLGGAAGITVAGQLLAGTTAPDAPTSWSLSNGLLRVEPSATGVLAVTSYLTGGWGTPKPFDVRRNGVSLGAAKHLTVLRNDPCETVIRLTWDHTPSRSTLDLTLVRGARHVALVAQQAVVDGPWRLDDAPTTGTASDQLSSAGYIASTTSDVDGNRWVIGTSVAATAVPGSPSGISLVSSSSSAAMPCFIGCVRGGASAVSGDTAADVNAQWLGQPAQFDRAVKR